MAGGARTFVCAPLHYQDKVIGTLELISAPAGRPERHAPAQARGGAAAVLHGRPAERGGAGHARPGPHQGEVHGHPPGGRVALPQGGAQQHRAAERERAGRGGRDGADRVRGRVPALRRWPTSAGSSVQRSVAIQADLLAQLGLAADVLRVRPARRGRSPRSTSSPTASTSTSPRSSGASTPATRPASSGSCARTSRACSITCGGFGREVRARIEAYRGALDPRLGRGLPAAPALRGERHAHRRGHLRVPRPRGAGRAQDDVPALLREAEDRRRGLPDLRGQ